MQYLTKLNDSPDATYYEIGGDHASRVKRYVVSTPQTRDICNRPEHIGCEFTDSLRQAVINAILHAPFRSILESYPEQRVCVLNYLRGGLNFDIRGALHQALGFNRHASAFMSSQRSKTEDGRWKVKEDMYRKLLIPRGAFVLAGDVVATGITVENGFDVLLDHLARIGSSIRQLVFFTIGCHKIEKQLITFDAKFRKAFDDYEGCHAVYLEGKFHLVDSQTELRIGTPGTDLIRRDAILAPEFEVSQWERVSYPLERCTIYDAGSRAFDTPGYLNEVLEYWLAVRELAEKGLTLREALAERWPTTDYASFEIFVERKKTNWRGVSDEFLEEAYKRYTVRWADRPDADEDTPKALMAVCTERIDTLRAQLD